MPGSGKKINYQVRPSKSVERKMMCELVKKVQIIRGISELRYIGMGSKYFTDFLLFHNEFGVTDMISIESEQEREMRYEFNKPLKNIQMMYGTTNEILPQIEGYDEKMNFVWLDYDGLFSEDTLYDIETLCRNLRSGSVFFVSCNYSYNGANPSEKKAALKEVLGDFFDESMEDYIEKSIKKPQYTRNNIPKIIRMLFNKQVEEVLYRRNANRREDKLDYIQLIFITYSDGAPMMTLGGIFVDEKLKEEIKQGEFGKELIFLSNNENPFNIEVQKLTNKEVQFILKVIPVKEEEWCVEKFHGIELDEIRKFEQVYRYYPHYIEGQIQT